MAEDVFGPGEHSGVLVRDRYSGYDNTFRGRQQYCFEHLKRDCQDLLEKEPENREYKSFVPKFVDLLREAMKLRSRDIPDGTYHGEALRIKGYMLKMINAEARDPGLQKYQDIFRRHPDRIFQWVEDRRVPAENNMSERGVRRTVIARKTCGGSQSEDALMVREILQSVIGTLRLRCSDPVAVNLASGECVLGASQVPSVSVNVGGGRTFRIVAKGLSVRAKHEKSVTLNGYPLKGFVLRHSDIENGWELVFEMTD